MHSPAHLPAASVAALLFAQGVSPDRVATDPDMGRAIADACCEAGIQAGRCCGDLAGVRAALARLWGGGRGRLH